MSVDRPNIEPNQIVKESSDPTTDNEVTEDKWSQWSASYASRDYLTDDAIGDQIGSLIYVLGEMHTDFIDVQQQVSQSVYVQNVISIPQVISGSTVNKIETIGSGDPTPSVNGSSLFKTANSSGKGAADITAFDDAEEGQKITILINDDHPDFTHDGVSGRTTNGLVLKGGVDWDTSAAGDSITFIYNGSKWIETNRSDNS